MLWKISSKTSWKRCLSILLEMYWKRRTTFKNKIQGIFYLVKRHRPFFWKIIENPASKPVKKFIGPTKNRWILASKFFLNNSCIYSGSDYKSLISLKYKSGVWKQTSFQRWNKQIFIKHYQYDQAYTPYADSSCLNYPNHLFSDHPPFSPEPICFGPWIPY